MKSPYTHIPIEFLRDRFDCNENGELFWKERAQGVGAAPGGFNPRLAGKRAGRINNRGYWMVTLLYEGRLHKVLNHRIVWALTHGSWPSSIIDHINRVRSDNRPSNLRQVTHSENMRNNVRAAAHRAAREAALAAIKAATGEQIASDALKEDKQ